MGQFGQFNTLPLRFGRQCELMLDSNLEIYRMSDRLLSCCDDEPQANFLHLCDHPAFRVCRSTGFMSISYGTDFLKGEKPKQGCLSSSQESIQRSTTYSTKGCERCAAGKLSPAGKGSSNQLEKRLVCPGGRNCRFKIPVERGKWCLKNPQKYSKGRKSTLNKCQVQRAQWSCCRIVASRKNSPSSFYPLSLLQLWRATRWGRGMEGLDGERERVPATSPPLTAAFLSAVDHIWGS